MPEQFSSIQSYNIWNSTILLVIGFLLIAFDVAVKWRIFQKADRPGYLALIPLVNMFVEMDILNAKPWTALIYLFPPFAFVYYVINSIRMSVCYNMGVTFGILGVLLNPFMRAFIAFSSDAKYLGPRTIGETFSK